CVPGRRHVSRVRLRLQQDHPGTSGRVRRNTQRGLCRGVPRRRDGRDPRVWRRHMALRWRARDRFIRQCVLGYGDSCCGDTLKLFQYNTTSKTFDQQTPTFGTAGSNGGGWMVLTANGSTSGTGVLWGINPASQFGPSRTLYALNAETLAQLWSVSVGA